MTTGGSPFSKRSAHHFLPARSAHRNLIHVDAHAGLLVLTFIAFFIMAWGYFGTRRPISLLVNNQPLTVFSNQATVGGVLYDSAISLGPEDVTFPDLDAPVPDNQPISISLALPIQVQVDGETITRRTRGKNLGEALADANIVLKPGDRIFVDGQQVLPSAQLVRAEGSNPFDPVPPVALSIQRAVPIQIDDNGSLTTFYTTAPTLGEALRQAGLIVYLGDYVSPELGTPVTPGWQVYIRRSRAATIQVDNRTIKTRTRSDTIAGLLAQEGVELHGKDYTSPPSTREVTDGMTVQVTRVKEDTITESEPIPYETIWQADPTLEIDQRRVLQAGVQGVKKRQIRIQYENGREIRRSLDREWIEPPPVTRVIGYGTKIVKRELTLPDGSTATYWRKIRVLVTSYTAATSGKAPSNPAYGITYTGTHAGTGKVAVDPHLINLRARLYIPGYGIGSAEDTGGRIKGFRVDLGYDEDDLVLWYKWLDIYLLDPIPSPDQIRWVLPDAPTESGN